MSSTPPTSPVGSPTPAALPVIKRARKVKPPGVVVEGVRYENGTYLCPGYGHVITPPSPSGSELREILDSYETESPKLTRTYTIATVCPDHPPCKAEGKSEGKCRTKSVTKKAKVTCDDPPTVDKRSIAKTPRVASAPLQLWSACVKEIAASMKVKPPIKKGTPEYEAIQALYNSKKPKLESKETQT